MALGIVLAPYGRNPDGTSPPHTVNYSGVNRHRTLCPDDPQFNTRDQAGLYYDTPLGSPMTAIGRKIQRWRINKQRRLQGLGDIPTDAELATVRGYTPVTSGWISSVSPKAFVTGPWVPPNGQNYGGYAPPVALNGLRDGATDDVITSMNAHNDRVFALTLVSTAAVAISAMLTIFRTVRLIHVEKR